MHCVGMHLQLHSAHAGVWQLIGRRQESESFLQHFNRLFESAAVAVLGNQQVCDKHDLAQLAQRPRVFEDSLAVDDRAVGVLVVRAQDGQLFLQCSPLDRFLLLVQHADAHREYVQREERFRLGPAVCERAHARIAQHRREVGQGVHDSV